MDKQVRARIIAFYLPQYHPIPENDKYWGKGFTEWTNVASAKPLFRGHYQPRIPADLGFYDLRLPEVQIAQAELAKNAGIEGFMYWHYWFGNGRMLLEKPFETVLKSGKPNFPFCLGWANHDWTTKTWEKGKALFRDKMIAKQEYLGEKDDILHFNYCLQAFRDHRYVRIEDKPVFVIYSPAKFVEINRFIALWNKLAIQNGLKGIYFIGLASGRNSSYSKVMELGFDGVCNNNEYGAEVKVTGSLVKRRLMSLLGWETGTLLMKFDYGKIIEHLNTEENFKLNCYPIITPGLDRTPRAGKRAVVYHGATPEKFKKLVMNTCEYVDGKDFDHKIIFLKSWNEWGEGNYMEPDLKYGHGYLDALRTVIIQDNKY